MNCSNKNKQEIAEQLKNFKSKLSKLNKNLKNSAQITGDECCECGSPECIWNKYDHFNDAEFELKPCDFPFIQKEETTQFSNITFVPGVNTQGTKVYVGEDSVQLQGVTKAVLVYDANMELPVLKLEILAPKVLW